MNYPPTNLPTILMNNPATARVRYSDGSVRDLSIDDGPNRAELFGVLAYSTLLAKDPGTMIDRKDQIPAIDAPASAQEPFLGLVARFRAIVWFTPEKRWTAVFVPQRSLAPGECAEIEATLLRVAKEIGIDAAPAPVTLEMSSHLQSRTIFYGDPIENSPRLPLWMLREEARVSAGGA